ncbi:MAG: TolC family protein [Thermodesulfobacteriota bacterium]
MSSLPRGLLLLLTLASVLVLGACAALNSDPAEGPSAETGEAGDAGVPAAVPEPAPADGSGDPAPAEQPPAGQAPPAAASDGGGADPAEPDNHIFTLNECLVRALRRNPALRSAALDVEAARLAKEQAFTSFLPSLSLTYSYTRLDEDPYSSGLTIPGLVTLPPSQAGDRDNYELTGTITQPLFTGFASTSQYRLAQLGLNVAEIARDQAAMDMVLRVKQAYFGMLEAKKSLEVAEQSVKQLEAHLEMTKSFFDVGLVPKNQVLQAEVQLAQSVQQKTLAEHGLMYARSALNTLMQRPMDAPLEVEDVLVHKPLGKSLEECLAAAQVRRPEILATQRQIRMKEYGIMLAKSGHYPTVSLMYNKVKKGDTWEVEGGRYHEGDSWNFMALATWRLWEWGRTDKEVQKKEAEHRQARSTLVQVQDAVQLEVKQAYLNLQAAEKNITVGKKAVEQAEENFRMAQERYKEQVAPATDVIDAETLLTHARTNYYRALYDYNLAVAVLERAMGLRYP